MRRDGFAPVGGYGVIGDGRSAALVAADGAVDWWTVPAMDAPPVFAAILDPEEGGTFALEPAVPFRSARRYLPDTNVLETTFTTDGGLVRVVDSLNRDITGPLAWTELAREVRAGLGEVPMRWRLAPGDRFGRARPWAWRHDGTPLLRLEDQMIAVVTEGAGEPRVGRSEISGEFVARPGRDVLLALTATDGEPAAVPDPAQVRDRLRATEESWRHWAGTVSYRGPDRDLVVRSALVLKLLTYEPTGALLAAATTSLPERIGGERNFDYRYGWVRDTSFALDALIGLGLQGDVHATLSWLLRVVSGTAPDIRPFYGLRGSVPAEGGELGVGGYRDSRPAHDGNKAVSQPQWGNFGDMLESVWLAAGRGLAALDRAAPGRWSGWPTGSATCGPGRTRASGSSGPDGTTRSSRWRAGWRWTGWSGWPTAANSRRVTPGGGGRRRPRSAPGWTSTAGRRTGAATASTPGPASWTPRCCWQDGWVSCPAAIRGSPWPSTRSAVSWPTARCCTGTQGPGSRRERSWPARSGSSTPW
jgi:Glycosyl hydrolases family 15/Trehalase-like, N-terminal